MRIEDAIMLLRSRAEYAQQKADTTDKRRKAADFVTALNTIIDFYNTTEQANNEQNNLSDIITALCEYIGVSDKDTEAIKNTDARFVKKCISRLKEHNNNPYWVLHSTAFNCMELQCDIDRVNEWRNTIKPIFEQRAKEEHERNCTLGNQFDGKGEHARYDALRGMEEFYAQLEDSILDRTTYV